MTGLSNRALAIVSFVTVALATVVGASIGALAVPVVAGMLVATVAFSAQAHRLHLGNQIRYRPVYARRSNDVRRFVSRED